MAKMKLRLADKDLEIQSLHNELERGEEAERAKHLQEQLAMCLREKEMERKARLQLEKNLEQLNTTFMVLRQSKFENKEEVVLMQVSLVQCGVQALVMANLKWHSSEGAP